MALLNAARPTSRFLKIETSPLQIRMTVRHEGSLPTPELVVCLVRVGDSEKCECAKDVEVRACQGRVHAEQCAIRVGGP